MILKHCIYILDHIFKETRQPLNSNLAQPKSTADGWTKQPNSLHKLQIFAPQEMAYLVLLGVEIVVNTLLMKLSFCVYTKNDLV